MLVAAAVAVASAASPAAIACSRRGEHLWSAGTPSGLSIEVRSNGCYSVTYAYEAWFTSAVGAELVVDGERLRSMPDNRGTLRVSDSSPSTGSDILGSYSRLSLTWTAPSSVGPVHILHTFTLRQERHSLEFAQRFQSRIPGANVTGTDQHDQAGRASAWGRPGASFPVFDASGTNVSASKLGGATGLGYVAYGEIGMPYAGRFPTEFKSGGVQEDGVPLAFLDEATGTAAVLAPNEGVYDNVCDYNATCSEGGDGGCLRCGVPGTATAIPAGFLRATTLQFSSPSGGLTEAWLALGDALLAVRRKPRTPPGANAQVERLGYSTVGHYFYGLALGHTAEETLRAVKAAASAGGVPPFGYYLIDSWWYGEAMGASPANGTVAGYGGTRQWDPQIATTPSMFPSGLRALREVLGAPFVMHMGMWTGTDEHAFPGGAPPYASNASWDWVVEANASIPRPASAGAARFWEWLFATMAAHGLGVYKLDHSQQQMPNQDYLLRTLGSTEAWLREMARAAERHGVDKQYGGHISSGFLHSAFLPNARAARVGPDYIPSSRKRPPNTCNGADDGPYSSAGNVLIARNALYPWALGIRPYKDAFLSGPQRWHNTTCFVRPTPGGPAGGGPTVVYPEWYGLQEANSELQALVSALLAGPVAVADGIGDTDARLVRRLARADGVLLKPDRPMVPLDAVWMRDCFGGGGGQPAGKAWPDGELAATHTTIMISSGHRRGDDGGVGSSASEGGGRRLAMRWDFVYGTALKADYVVTASDNHIGGPHGVAWRRVRGDSFGTVPPSLVPYDERTAPLALPFRAQPSSDGWAEYTYWRTAPTSCDGKGWALLGELDKLVSVSAQRVAALAEHCGGGGGGDGAAAIDYGLTVDLVGAARGARDLVCERRWEDGQGGTRDPRRSWPRPSDDTQPARSTRRATAD